MERDELIKRIASGSAYLHRDDISEQEKEVAVRKLAKYREQLREMDTAAEAPKPVEPDIVHDDERVKRSIEAIRAILQPAKTHMEKIEKGETA